MFNIQPLLPESGLVRDYTLSAIDTKPSLFCFVIDVGQRLGTFNFGLDDRVGAWDTTLSGAFERGLGEAVERFALISSDKDVVMDQSACARIPLVSEAMNLPSPTVDSSLLGATRESLSAGRELVLVDADWVNLPTSHGGQIKGWYGTPSGTGAHKSLADAIDSSLRELLERDAVLAAWHGQRCFARAQTFRRRECRSADKLNQILANGGISLYRIPTCVGLPDAYMAWAITPNSAAAGACVKRCPVCAALHAAVEALQVQALLSERQIQQERFKPSLASKMHAASFADASSKRMKFWGSADGVDAWNLWAAGAKHANSEPPLAEHVDTLLSTADIINRGLTYIWVDLTYRLPEQIRDLGYTVVKGFIPELRALAMNEWNPRGEPKTTGESWEPLI